jgi:hypothetical protein
MESEEVDMATDNRELTQKLKDAKGGLGGDRQRDARHEGPAKK